MKTRMSLETGMPIDFIEERGLYSFDPMLGPIAACKNIQQKYLTKFRNFRDTNVKNLSTL